MRFLMREQAYEKPLAAGKLRYERDGQPTGAVEHWRLTQALDGHQFLRVDLDGRASTGNSFLYNLLLNAQGQPENFRWRFFNQARRARGQLLFEEEQITAVRSLEQERFESERPFGPQSIFFFPSTVGLSLLKDAENAAEVVRLNMQAEGDDFMCLQLLDAKILQGDSLVVTWEDQRRELWLNGDGWPERMERQDGLTAVVERYMEYQ